jgi:hypothetical protein
MERYHTKTKIFYDGQGIEPGAEIVNSYFYLSQTFKPYLSSLAEPVDSSVVTMILGIEL